MHARLEELRWSWVHAWAAPRAAGVGAGGADAGALPEVEEEPMVAAYTSVLHRAPARRGGPPPPRCRQTRVLI